MDSDYYIRDRGRVQGPFSAEKLRQLARRGRFGRHFEVSEDGHQWSRAAAYPELFPEPPKRKRRTPEKQVSNVSAAGQETADMELEVDGAADAEPALWFYARDSQELGPVPFSTLRSLATQGHLSQHDLVWTDGMPDWVPASQIVGIWSEDAAGTGTRTAAHAASVGEPGVRGTGGTAPLAIASLILGILGTNLLFFLGSLLAVVFGHIALKQIRESRGVLTGRGLALAGLILGYAFMVTTVVAGVAFVLYFVAQQGRIVN